MSELSRQSTRDGALQRYVIAWVERRRALAAATSALQTMGQEDAAARRELRQRDGWAVVELLDGAVCDVFVDTAGIVVLPRHDGDG